MRKTAAVLALALCAWSGEIQWKTFADAAKRAKETKKPMALVFGLNGGGQSC